MSVNSHISAAAVLLLAGVLPLLCYALTVASRQYRSIRRDAILFRIFAARDKLYLAAADGLIDPQSETFQRMRDGLNFLIRNSDEAGAIQFFIMTATKREEPLDSFVNTLPEKARAPYVEVLSDAARAVFDLFLLNSRVLRVWHVLKSFVHKAETRPRPVAVEELEHRIDEAEKLRGRLCAA